MNHQKFTTRLTAFVLFLFMSLQAGAQGEMPKEIKISGSYYFPKSKIQPVCAYLSKELGIQVTAVDFSSTRELNKKLRNGRIDMAFLNPYSYVLAKQMAPKIEPLLVLGNKQGPYTYKSCIIANPAAGINSMTQLKKKARMLDFMFVHATSTSGHIVPRFHLKQIGLPQAEGKFSSIDFAGSHAEATRAVKKGLAHAGACGLPDIQYAINEGWLKKGAINILWTSHEITGSPLVAQRSLPGVLTHKVMALLMNLHNANPELWKYVEANWQAIKPERFIRASDSDWNNLRNKADSMEDLVLFLTYYLS